MADTLEELKRKGVLSHRILSMTGNMGAGTGHVFVRTPEGNEFLARSRHAGDTSPAFVNEDAYHLMTMDGKPAEDMGDWVYPPERHIAMAIFKARAETNVVIHAHPMYQVLCSIANVPLRPIVGPAYGGEAVTAAVKGIRVFPPHQPYLQRWAGARRASDYGEQRCVDPKEPRQCDHRHNYRDRYAPSHLRGEPGEHLLGGGNLSPRGVGHPQ